MREHTHEDHCGPCADLFMRQQALEHACAYAAETLPGHIVMPKIIVELAESFETYLQGRSRKTADLHVLNGAPRDTQDCQGERV